MLYPLLPVVPGATIRRAMFVPEDMHSLLSLDDGSDEDDEADDAESQRIGHLRADLERFVVGETVYPKYMFLLYPLRDGVWEIRSVSPDPSIRVLGLFASKNVWVATNYARREDLGGWQSREWKAVKREAAARWRYLFPAYQPLQTANIHELVSGAINGQYFKQ